MLAQTPSGAMFTASRCTTTKGWRQANVQQQPEWKSKLRSAGTVEWDSATDGSEGLAHAAPRGSLGNVQ